MYDIYNEKQVYLLNNILFTSIILQYLPPIIQWNASSLIKYVSKWGLQAQP